MRACWFFRVLKEESKRNGAKVFIVFRRQQTDRSELNSNRMGAWERTLFIGNADHYISDQMKTLHWDSNLKHF